MFTEYVASTLISILTKKIVPLAIGLAKLYEEEAELYFALDSPENKHQPVFEKDDLHFVSCDRSCDQQMHRRYLQSSRREHK